MGTFKRYLTGNYPSSFASSTEETSLPIYHRDADSIANAKWKPPMTTIMGATATILAAWYDSTDTGTGSPVLSVALIYISSSVFTIYLLIETTPNYCVRIWLICWLKLVASLFPWLFHASKGVMYLHRNAIREGHCKGPLLLTLIWSTILHTLSTWRQA